MSNSQHNFIFLLVLLSHFIYGSSPLFKNSIVSTDIDFIKSSDSSSFKSMTFEGQSRQEMPDKRTDNLFSDDVYIFNMSFHDKSNVNILIHREIGNLDNATKYAAMMKGPLGKLPKVMRKNLSHVVIHNGDETAFAEESGNFFVLYSKNMEERIKNHDLEETVFHESIHATLDSQHIRSKKWISAQKKDRAFLTEYAKRDVFKEDFAETCLFIYTYMSNKDRLPENVTNWIEKNIPNRLTYIKKIFKD